MYIKDVFRKPGPLSEPAQADLTEFDRTFACRTRTLAEFVAAIAAAGFDEVAERNMTPEISTAHAVRAMFRARDGSAGLTSFGEKHCRMYQELPLLFGEIKAVRPVLKNSDTEPAAIYGIL